jgi:hypothetical protein
LERLSGAGAELDAGAEGEDDTGGLDAGEVGDEDEDDRLDGLGDADVNVDGDPLADWVAPAEAGAPEAVCPFGLAPAGSEDTCAAGDWAGAGGFPAKEVTAKEVAPDIANTVPATQPSTSGRRKRCPGRSGNAARLVPRS